LFGVSRVEPGHLAGFTIAGVDLAVLVDVHPGEHCGSVGLRFGAGHGLVAHRVTVAGAVPGTMVVRNRGAADGEQATETPSIAFLIITSSHPSKG